jgi:hypothetical protein
MNNRIPLFILGALVVLALIWRIANPPPPLLPGPLGRIPNWSSVTKIGDMGAAAVNPDTTMWAGAWNEKNKQGVVRSAVVIIDLEKRTAQHVGLGEGFNAVSLFWQDNKSFRVLMVDSAKPALVTRSRLVTCKVEAATTKHTRVSLETDVASVLTWPPGSDKFAVRLGGTPAKTAVLAENGSPIGKEITLEVPDSAKFYPVAALGPDGGSYVFGVEKSEVGGVETFYLADARTGAVKELFTSNDLPGIVDGMWVSPAGLLIVTSERNKFSEVKFDPASGKMVDIASSKGSIDLAKSWPDAPAKMMFATFDGGYQLDLATGKVKKILSFDTSDRLASHWRKETQGGRLYPRKDGDYTSISYMAREVDIRIIGKDGKSMDPILKRR